MNDICPYCGKPIDRPGAMDKVTLLRRLASLNIPGVVDVTMPPIPNVFYVQFSQTLNTSQERQLEMIGFASTYDADTYVRGRYLLRWTEGQ